MTAPFIDLTVERVRELLDYDPKTGVLTRPTASRGRRAGVVGHVQPDGYRVVMVDRRKYAAHRLIWFYVHGVWPAEDLDHVNGERDDNRIANLRPATRAQNCQNRKINRSNTSGFKGVSYCSQTGRWRAQINRRHLGRFDTAELAHVAYCAAAKKLFGEFAHVG